MNGFKEAKNDENQLFISVKKPLYIANKGALKDNKDIAKRSAFSG